MAAQSLPVVSAPQAPAHVKPAVDPITLTYKKLLSGPFWQKIPAYKNVDEATFLDHLWQAKNSITKPQKLLETVQDLVPPGFMEDAETGFKHAPMSVRVSPYMVALIDWTDPHRDPIRTQFIPLGTKLMADHPCRA